MMRKQCAWMVAAAVCGVLAVPAMAEDEAPKELKLTGVIRDFKVSHVDFESYPDTSRLNITRKNLDDEGKPVLNTNKSGGAVYSMDSFAQWFRDVEGVNKRIEYAITLKPHPNKPGVYWFAREKPNYFFPIDNAGWGKSGGKNDPLVDQRGRSKPLRWASGNPDKRNFHFTYELRTKFTYTPRSERPRDMVFEFTGDDDVFVFINGRLAVDLGGVHQQEKGSINLDTGEFYRQGQKKATIDLGLQPGETYELALFFAERHTSESNFRIETTLELQEIKPTTVKPTYD